jgi:hypothetical protein
MPLPDNMTLSPWLSPEEEVENQAPINASPLLRQLSPWMPEDPSVNRTTSQLPDPSIPDMDQMETGGVESPLEMNPALLQDMHPYETLLADAAAKRTEAEHGLLSAPTETDWKLRIAQGLGALLPLLFSKGAGAENASEWFQKTAPTIDAKNRDLEMQRRAGMFNRASDFYEKAMEARQNVMKQNMDALSKEEYFGRGIDAQMERAKVMGGRSVFAVESNTPASEAERKILYDMAINAGLSIEEAEGYAYDPNLKKRDVTNLTNLLTKSSGVEAKSTTIDEKLSKENMGIGFPLRELGEAVLGGDMDRGTGVRLRGDPKLREDAARLEQEYRVFEDGISSIITLLEGGRTYEASMLSKQVQLGAKEFFRAGAAWTAPEINMINSAMGLSGVNAFYSWLKQDPEEMANAIMSRLNGMGTKERIVVLKLFWKGARRKALMSSLAAGRFPFSPGTSILVVNDPFNKKITYETNPVYLETRNKLGMQKVNQVNEEAVNLLNSRKLKPGPDVDQFIENRIRGEAPEMWEAEQRLQGKFATLAKVKNL